MKKISLFVSLALLIGSVAMAATNVVSVNVVGYTKIDLLAGQLEMIAVPFDPVGGATKYTLDELLGTNHLNASYSVALAARAIIWDGTKYLQAYLNDGTWNQPAIDWKWCYKDGTATTNCSSNSAYDLEVGSAFWIVNKNDTTITLLGQVPAALTTDTQMYVGMRMLGNPYPVARTLDQLISTNDGAKASYSVALADQIILWDGTKYLQAYLNDGTWNQPAIDWKWCYKVGAATTNCSSNSEYTIQPGQGFWYLGKGSNFVWTADRPYDL